MERAIITISENGKVNIPRGNFWMSEMELVELFGVIAPTLRVAIKAIYKSGTLCPVSTQRCDLATPASWATFYNLEVVIEGFARFSVCFKAFLVMLRYTELCLLYEYWNRMGS